MQASQTDSPEVSTAAVGGDAWRRIAREHESFCRSAALQLSAQLQLPIELELTGISQRTWRDALRRIPHPSVYALLDVQPLGTTLVLSAELGAVMRSVTRLLGGFDPPVAPERPLTEIELVLARHVFATLVDSLATTWRELLGIELSLGPLETEPDAVQVAPAYAPALVVSLELGDGSGTSTLCLLVPYHAIAPVLEQSAPEAEPEVDVELRAEVAELELPIEEVLGLREGDVVTLGIEASSGVRLLVDGVPVHRARPGRSGNRRAVQVIEPL
jgi:flagellar motor switch protein FliM